MKFKTFFDFRSEKYRVKDCLKIQLQECLINFTFLLIFKNLYNMSTVETRSIVLI